MFLEISSYSQENICVGAFFYGTRPVTASVSAKTKNSEKSIFRCNFFELKNNRNKNGRGKLLVDLGMFPTLYHTLPCSFKFIVMFSSIFWRKCYGAALRFVHFVKTMIRKRFAKSPESPEKCWILETNCTKTKASIYFSMQLVVKKNRRRTFTEVPKIVVLSIFSKETRSETPLTGLSWCFSELLNS